jgi:choline dehydrogenase-like flavoprotein
LAITTSRAWDAGEDRSIMPIIDSSDFAGGDVLPELLRCDVCIIGTGPAGITIARELSGTPLRVTLLESGGTERQEASDALNDIESCGWPRVMDQWAVRNRMVGGSSNTWSGRCAPFDEIDMQRRSWVPYSGWPFKIGDLASYIDRSAKHLGLGVGNGITDDRIWALTGQPRRSTGPDPDPDKLLPMFWQYSRDTVNHYDNTRFAHFTDTLGPNITIVTNATALRINATESAAAVESVEFASADGRPWSLPASIIVLCAGGIENARLLLSSDNVAPHGLGNDRDLVGRFLMDHLRGPIAKFPLRGASAVLNQFGTFKSPAAGGNIFQPGLRLSPAIQHAEGLLSCSAWVHEYIAADDPWEMLIHFLRREPGARPDFRSMLANSGLVIYGLKEHFISHRALPRKLAEVALEAMCEQVPNPDSRITLSSRRDRLGLRISRIDWRVSEEEARTMRRMAELMVNQFSLMGIEPPGLEEWVRDGDMIPHTFQDVAHPTGTTRMADDPAQGVVDAQCQVHGVHGLFIGGSSVFPTAGHANPTQLIVALAVRLADTLRDRVSHEAGIRMKPLARTPETT